MGGRGSSSGANNNSAAKAMITRIKEPTTKQDFIDKMNVMAELGNQQGVYNYKVKTTDWENYGKSRTYLKITETRASDGKPHGERDYGYFDNNSGKYVKSKAYANFINRNNVKKFFELDIDSVVGYDKVLEYRRKLERLTNKLVIPVWHKSRGVKEYQKMCDEYPYVAIGGIVSKEIKPKQYKLFPALIQEAHRRKAKIHGLGFTSTSLYGTIKFDTVDSTTWAIGGRMGNMCYFNGEGMRQYYPSLNGKKPININKLTRHNYSEWIKFQKYAERNL